jgi:PiT family inorganic phosphate transporter
MTSELRQMNQHASIATQIPRIKLDQAITPKTIFLLVLIISGGFSFAAWSVYQDIKQSGAPVTTYLQFILLALTLFIALGFEFVNGFHDTANAVATVIYTHSLQPHFAVVWSGIFNFLGVMVSSGGVAFGIVSLLPVELILQVGSSAGFAMVFALLTAAIIWNVGTWLRGLPASSSHTLIGSIIGVGIANSLMSGHNGTSGVDWSKAVEVGYSLVLSPTIGFIAAALLLLMMKLVVRVPKLYMEPQGQEPPPWWIRGLLIITCTGVSFAHGSNDGQKGMGLIMLILIGTVPTSYALNRALPKEYISGFSEASDMASLVVKEKSQERATIENPREIVTNYISRHELNEKTYPALSEMITNIREQIQDYDTISQIPFAAVGNTRNDIYLVSEAIRFLEKDKHSNLSSEDRKALNNYKTYIDKATKFIPTWVKIVVAIALGLGTMIGWKKIVVTVGEKIGKEHLTYGQGAAAELVAMSTIAAADVYGLPVSTTHVLSSGVAGAMAANGSGVQMNTVRNLLWAWVLTLPCAIVLSGSLYFILFHLLEKFSH